MRVPDVIGKCTVFVGVKVETDGQAEVGWRGTAFIVSVPADTLPGRAFHYLVTANHVAVETTKRESIVRMNLRSGGAKYFALRSTRWWCHPEDSSTDVAVVPFPHNDDALDFMPIPVQMFTSDPSSVNELVGLGDEVFMTGLFANLAGDERNIPIVRTGTLAMVPDEKVVTNLGNMDAYLIEVRSIAGLSGSPVFIRETKYLKDFGVYASGTFHLLGLVHGHWDLPLDVSQRIPRALAPVNMGIGIVVPARKILETINHPELAQRRADAEGRLGAMTHAEQERCT